MKLHGIRRAARETGYLVGRTDRRVVLWYNFDKDVVTFQSGTVSGFLVDISPWEQLVLDIRVPLNERELRRILEFVVVGIKAGEAVSRPLVVKANWRYEIFGERE